MSGDTPSSYITSSPHAVFTNPFQEGGYAQHLDRSCPTAYSTSQHNIMPACSWPYKNWHSRSQPSLTQQIDVRVHNNNSRSVDDIVIRSRVKSKPLPGASYLLHHELQRQLSHKTALHSDPTSPSLRTSSRGDDLVSEEHAIMSPNLSACNSVRNSRIPAILGSMEMLTCILIPNSKIGAVIGKGGSIIKKIRESSGAKITICSNCSGASGLGGGENAADDSGDRMVTIAGLYLTVLAAFSAIVRQTEPVFGKGGNDEPTRGGGGHNSGSTCVRLLVPNNKAGGLIGRGGSTIRAIREQSCARIEISTQGLAVLGGGLLDRVVTIMGTFSACIRAYEMICLQLVGIPNSGPFATSPTSQNDAEHGNGWAVHGGGMVNTPMSQIHQQSRSGHQQQNLGCGVGVYHGTMALQFSPVPQVGSPFHVPPSSSSPTQQFERLNRLPPSGYVPPTTWENIAPHQGGLHTSASASASTSYLGCLPHSLNTNGRRRSSSTPDSYYRSSSSSSFFADFTSGVIRNVCLKDDEKMYNPSTAASVPISCNAPPAPIKITVDMDIPYEALTAMRLDHGFSNIMNISGAVLEELQTMPVSTSSGLHGDVGKVDVKGDGGVKRVEELDVEEFNKQGCDSSGRKDECNEEDGQSDLLEQQEKSLTLKCGHDCCAGYSLPSLKEVSLQHTISTSFNSSLSSLKDSTAFDGGCISSSNRISITGTLEEIELAQLLVTSRLTQKKDDVDVSCTDWSAQHLSAFPT